jgi:hypothetical protein
MTERLVAIKVTSDGKAFVVDQAANADAVKKLGDQVKSTNEEISRQNAAMSETSRKVTAGFQDQGYAAKVLAEQELAAAEATDQFMFKLQQQAAQAGKTKSELLALQAAQHGVTAEAAPFIAAIDSASSSHGKFSLASAGATRELLVLGNEMANGRWTRFGGSLNVLAQQTGAVSLLMSPLGAAAIVAAAGVGILAVAAIKGAAETKRLNEALVLTNGYAELTADRFNAASASVAAAANAGIGKGRDALLDLAATGRVSGDALDLLAKDVVRTSELTGEKLSDVAKDYAKMADGVAKWAEEHNKSMHFMGLAQYEHIKALEEQGKKQAAMIEVGKLLDAQLDHQAPRLGLLERAWHSLGVAVSDTWDKMLGVGRPTTANEKVDALTQAVFDARSKIARLQQLPSGSKDTQLALLQAQKDLQTALYQQSIAQDSVLEQRRQTGHNAEMARVNEEGIAAVDRINKQILSYDKVAAVQKQLDAARRDFDAAAAAGHAVSAKDQQTIIDGIQAQIKVRKQSVDGVNAEIEALKQADKAKQLEVKQSVADIESLVKQGVISQIQGITQVRDAELAGVDAHEAALKRELAIAKTKANSQTEQARLNGEITESERKRDDVVSTASNHIAEAIKKESDVREAAFNKSMAGSEADIVAINQRADVIEREIAVHGKNAQAIEAVAIARLEEKRAALEEFDPAAAAARIDQIDREIAARRRLVTDLDSKDAIAANDRAAKQAEEAWTRSDHSIEEGLYSALADGSGRGLKKIEHDLKDWALHFVLQIPVQFLGQMGASILNPTAASATAGGGYGGLFSTATQASSLYGQGSGLLSSVVAGYNGVGTATAIGATGDAMGGAAGILGAADSSAASAALGLGADAAATSAATAGIASGVTGAATAAMAAIPVVGWVALAGLALYSVFGGKGGGPKTEGGYAPGGLNIAGVDIGGSQQGSQRGDVAGAQQISQAISTGLTGLGNEFGITIAKDVGVFFAKDPQGDSQTQLNVVSDNYSRSATEGGIENVGRSDAEFQAALTKATAQLDLTELAKALSGKIGDYLKALDPKALTADQITADIQLAANAQSLYTSFSKLGPAFAYVSDLSVQAVNDLANAAGGMDKFNAALSTYYDNYFTDEEKRAALAGQISQTLAKAGVNISADAVLAAAASNDARSKFRQLTEQMAALGPDGQKAYLALLSVNGAFASLTSAAQLSSSTLQALEAAATANTTKQITDDVTAAQEALNAARKAETTSVQSTVTALTSATANFRTFAGNLRDFRDSLLLGDLSPLTPGQKYAESRRQFESTYAAAQGGDPAAMAKLQDVSTAFLQASQVYNASSTAYQADFAEVQGALTLSASKADALATQNEAQLAILNAQLSSLETVNSSVLSVKDAIAALAQAVGAAIHAGVNPGANAVSSLTGGVTGQWVDTQIGKVYSSTAGAASTGGTIYAINGQSYTMGQAVSYINTLLGDGKETDAYYAFKSAGISLADADKLMQWAPQTAESWATAHNLPIFHDGMSFVPSTGMALLEQGEAVIKRSRNPFAGGGGAGDESALVQEMLTEIKALRADAARNAQLLAEVIARSNAAAAATVVQGTVDAASRANFGAAQRRAATVS